MIPLDGLLSSGDLGALIRSVLLAYNPASNKLNLTPSNVVEHLRLRAQSVVGRRLVFFRAYLFLVSETTIETARTNPSDGWHVDGTSSIVDGDCFNVWVPLYNSSNGSGLEVIPNVHNLDLYSEISGHLSTSTVLVRPNATDVLGKIGVDPESDFVILFDGNRRVLELPSSSLRVASIQNAVIGDGAVFNQTDFHRGKHADGIRIQLTLKFIDATARVNESCADAELMKPLTKHGRLEAQLVRELLGLQLRLIAGSSARSPAREPI